MFSDTSQDKRDTPKSNEDEQITCEIQDVHISADVYNNIMREKEPSHFITNMSYAVWGPEVLASRCVRSQSNVVEPELTPTKKYGIVNEFEKWMRIKRKMPQMLIDEQLHRSKVNKYFNGAITAARKKLNYKMKRTLSQKEAVENKIRAETTKEGGEEDEEEDEEEEDEEEEDEEGEKEEEASDDMSNETIIMSDKTMDYETYMKNQRSIKKIRK
ncbi:histone acetyltransferase KAT6B-like [Temnothorax curvispinosus]|uniref:Histone acetyltransferase KAT6B-like n=1 Tax=Temnothorax curvispinosus TaxID=300111 RepID=A0A6J1Q8J3_9HYME|nr:histone acetyltransferase KAT6B-like [Temnothorax curvispinosus]